jgi:hypothetical protein
VRSVYQLDFFISPYKIGFPQAPTGISESESSASANINSAANSDAMVDVTPPSVADAVQQAQQALTTQLNNKVSPTDLD